MSCFCGAANEKVNGKDCDEKEIFKAWQHFNTVLKQFKNATPKVKKAIVDMSLVFGGVANNEKEKEKEKEKKQIIEYYLTEIRSGSLSRLKPSGLDGALEKGDPDPCVEKRVAEAQYRLGHIYFPANDRVYHSDCKAESISESREDYEEKMAISEAYFEAAAKAGHVKAKVELAQLLVLFRVDRPEPLKIFRLLLEAQFSPEAAYLCGLCHFNGIGVEVNHVAALAYYQHSDAQARGWPEYAEGIWSVPRATLFTKSHLLLVGHS